MKSIRKEDFCCIRMEKKAAFVEGMLVNSIHVYHARTLSKVCDQIQFG